MVPMINNAMHSFDNFQSAFPSITLIENDDRHVRSEGQKMSS
jgi:hypothetical protein